jgi:hypothetical protein
MIMGYLKNRKTMRSQIKSENLRKEAELACSQNEALYRQYKKECIDRNNFKDNPFAMEECEKMKSELNMFNQSCIQKTKEYEHTPIQQSYSRRQFKEMQQNQDTQLAELMLPKVPQSSTRESSSQESNPIN